MELRILKVEKGALFGKLLLKQMVKSPFPSSSDQVLSVVDFFADSGKAILHIS